MYGTRKAADGWHSEYAGRLVQELHFEVGDASACVFYQRAKNLRCSVHGDDITTVGSKVDLDWFKAGTWGRRRQGGNGPEQSGAVDARRP